MRILCLDIGNTHTHFAVLENRRARHDGKLPTTEISERVPALVLSEKILSEAIDGISFCSVVPEATLALEAAVRVCAPALPVCKVFHGNHPGLGIHYPEPHEIGPDRLANCIGAQARFGEPAVIIDMGTAVTFDILTARGYEGGIIAPGLEIMTRYLHEQTALLPALDPKDLLLGEDAEGIGKSTVGAMKLGCAVGFSGMIGELLEKVLSQLQSWNVINPTIITTGGCAGMLPRSWAKKIRREPFITVQGLEEAFLRMNRENRKN